MKSLKNLMILILPLALFAAPIYYAQENQKVDKVPFPVGGMEVMAKNIVYPVEAKKAGIQGMVLVKAVVNVKGEVESAEIEKGVDPVLDKAALNAVKNTKFSPGEIKNQKVKASVTVPIKFELKKDCDTKET